MEVVVTTGATERAKFQSHHHRKHTSTKENKYSYLIYFLIFWIRCVIDVIFLYFSGI